MADIIKKSLPPAFYGHGSSSGEDRMKIQSLAEELQRK